MTNHISKDKQVDWVCTACGDKYGRRTPGVATWHTGECDICGETKSVTQPRDFGYLKRWRNK